MRHGCSHKFTQNWRGQAVWGFMLIAVGVGFLLHQVGVINLYDFWDYWPFLFVVSGAARMVGYPTPRDFMRALGQIFFGLWLYAVLQGMYGLTWMNAWPYLLIFWGVQLVLEPIVARSFAGNKEPHHE